MKTHKLRTKFFSNIGPGKEKADGSKGYLVLLVPGVGTVKEVDGHLVVLIQPLHHKRLEPAEINKEVFGILYANICAMLVLRSIYAISISVIFVPGRVTRRFGKICPQF
jgi:hypothetical protein